MSAIDMLDGLVASLFPTLDSAIKGVLVKQCIVVRVIVNPMYIDELCWDI